MLEFSSLFFLYIFLPLTLATYFLVPGIRLKNVVLVLASLVFYAMGQPLYLVLLLASVLMNYLFARRIQPNKKWTLLLPLICNLAVLLLFKYLDFLLRTVGLVAEGESVLLRLLQSATQGLNGLFHLELRAPVIVMPIGLSFYTFQVISYLVDVYRGKSKAQKSFWKLMLYLCMFPKMVQGPILRYEQIEPQLSERRTNPQAIFEGAVRFVIGLAKKVLLADYAGQVISGLAGDAAGSTVAGAWLSALMFMFQIYFDFSGYSDMAIGLGRIFGFRYAENFDLPYISGSVTEFWRRWHISLSTFFRDYVYIPLGGNRKGKGRRALNLLIVWALTGLWHGANWNYVLWGLYFFVLLTMEKQCSAMLKKVPYIVRNLLTMFLVLIGWVIFSHEDLNAMWSTLVTMFGGGPFWSDGISIRLLNSLPLLLACLLGASMIPRWFGFFFWSGVFRTGAGKNIVTGRKAVYLISVFVFTLLLLALCTVSLVGSTSAPSIYANF